MSSSTYTKKYLSPYTAWLLICFFCSVFLVALGASAQEVNLRPARKSDSRTAARAIKSKDCSSVVKPTKYLVQKGDHIAAILRTLQLEPVFGKNNSLESLLKINKVPNPDLIEPEQELAVPFNCEEQVSIWQSRDRGADRLLTRKKENFVTSTNQEVKPGALIEPAPEVVVVAPVETQTVMPEPVPVVNNAIKVQNTTDTIIDENKPIEELNRKNIDLMSDAPTQEVSEALRYRMICDGEWTGTECVTRYSILFVTLSGWYNRYDGVDPSVATNNRGTLLSKLNPTAGIGWDNYWTENFKTELFASMQQSQILPESREIPIESSRKYLGSFRFGARYETGPFGFGLGLKQYDKLFYRFRFSGLSQPCFSSDVTFAGCGVFVHAASVLALSADVSYMFYQAGKFRYDVRADFIRLGPAHTGGFDIQEGNGYDIGFRITHDRVKEYIFGDITYGVSEQNTSIEVQKATEVGFTFGYAWKLRDW